jgi:hypothetical protein
LLNIDFLEDQSNPLSLLGQAFYFKDYNISDWHCHPIIPESSLNR